MSVAQALLTAVGVGIIGLVVTVVFGLSGFDLSRHISFGIFSTMITLLAHSMMMFYLIGKGKAVKDAMAEGGLTGDH
jgi:5-bromo-4-chloroindolyl phosphate hydrolysis protein